MDASTLLGERIICICIEVEEVPTLLCWSVSVELKATRRIYFGDPSAKSREQLAEGN